jgi:predicted phage replisome organizer
MANKYFWLKLSENFFNQREIKKLRKLAGGDTLTIIYLKLQLLSIRNEGEIAFEGTEDSMTDQLSIEIDEDVENINMLIAYLQKNALLEVLNDNYFLPKASEAIGKESDSAERVRKFRERKTLQSNALVTTCNTYIEIENKKIDKKNKSIEKELFDFSNLTDDLRKSMIDFIDHRKKLKKPLTERSFDLILKELDKLGRNELERIQIINQSIMNGWQGIFELKEQKSMGKGKRWDDGKVVYNELTTDELFGS